LRLYVAFYCSVAVRCSDLQWRIYMSIGAMCERETSDGLRETSRERDIERERHRKRETSKERDIERERDPTVCLCACKLPDVSLCVHVHLRTLSVLQCVAVCCSVSRCVAVRCSVAVRKREREKETERGRRGARDLGANEQFEFIMTATHCIILQHTVTKCNKLQHSATLYKS